MADEKPNPLPSYVAARLRERAGAVVEDWIDWLETRIGTRTISALPRQELRNHIPPVVQLLASFIEAPIQAVREEMLGHLRIHAQVRRDQGYDLQELLAEFDGLGHQLAQCTWEALESCPEEVTVRDTFEIMYRLSTGVRAIAFVTVGIYQESQEYNRQELARRLEDFGRTIAHELGSPLNTIALGAQLLSREELAHEEREKHLHVIERAIDRTRDLLDDVRVLALAESASAAGRLVAFPTAVHTAIGELAAMADAREVAVTIDGELPACDVESVPMQLALVNLLGNAVKYSDREKGERWVRISASLDGSDDEHPYLVTVIEDNGVGIPKEMQERVFQRTFRAHPEVAEGTGLGLAITRQVLLERSGRIDLTSEPGKGTRIEFAVRAIDASAAGTRSKELPPSEVARRSIAAQGDLDEGPNAEDDA